MSSEQLSPVLPEDEPELTRIHRLKYRYYDRDSEIRSKLYYLSPFLRSFLINVTQKWVNDGLFAADNDIFLAHKEPVWGADSWIDVCTESKTYAANALDKDVKFSKVLTFIYTLSVLHGPQVVLEILPDPSDVIE